MKKQRKWRGDGEMLKKSERAAVLWAVGFGVAAMVVLVGVHWLMYQAKNSAGAKEEPGYGDPLATESERRTGGNPTSEYEPLLVGSLNAIVDYPFPPGARRSTHAVWYLLPFDPRKAQQYREKIEKESSGKQTVAILHGVPVVIPTDEKMRKSSNLDITVSLDLEDATAWEGVKSVLRQINCGRRFGEEMSFEAVFRHGYPVAFFESHCISLSLKDVPAREAVAAIVSRSPIKFSLVCENFAGFGCEVAYATLYFFKDGKELNWRYHSEAVDFDEMDRSWWVKERDEATLPADDCLRTPDEQAAEQ